SMPSLILSTTCSVFFGCQLCDWLPSSCVSPPLSRSVGSGGNWGAACKLGISEGRLPVPRGHELRAIEESGADEIGAGEIGPVEDGLEEVGANLIGARYLNCAQLMTARNWQSAF